MLSPIMDTANPPSGIVQSTTTPMIDDNLPLISGAVVFMIAAFIGAVTIGTLAPNRNDIKMTKIRVVFTEKFV